MMKLLKLAMTPRSGAAVLPKMVTSRLFCTQAAEIEIPKPSDFKNQKYFEVNDKTGIIVTLQDEKGVLNKALGILDKNGVNLTHIESKPSKYHKSDSAFDFYLDFYGTLEDDGVRKAISEISKISKHLTICGTPNVPWFPTSILDLDKIGRETLSEGEGIEMTDHPGFNDQEYKNRRAMITDVALKYHLHDKEIPRIDYNKNEVQVWSHVYPKLKELYKKGA
jgi:phenylalanine-4-hydroxylase